MVRRRNIVRKSEPSHDGKAALRQLWLCEQPIDDGFEAMCRRSTPHPLEERLPALPTDVLDPANGGGQDRAYTEEDEMKHVISCLVALAIAAGCSVAAQQKDAELDRLVAERRPRRRSDGGRARGTGWAADSWGARGVCRTGRRERSGRRIAAASGTHSGHRRDARRPASR